MIRDTNETMEEQVGVATSAPTHQPSDRSSEQQHGILQRQQRGGGGGGPCADPRPRSATLRKASDHSAGSSNNRRTPNNHLSSSLGDSIVSLDLDFLEDAVPPPELTRPEPLYRSNTSSATAPRASSSPWNRHGGSKDGNAVELSPTSRRNKPRPQALQSIMQEQSDEAQQHLLLLHNSTAGDSVYIEEINRVIEHDDDQAAAMEEAMIKLALERSLRSLRAERGGGGSGCSASGAGGIGNGSYHNSVRSLASDLAREVQMEADRTEQELVLNDGFQTPGSRSSRPSLSRLHSSASSRRINNSDNNSNDGSSGGENPAAGAGSGSFRRRPVSRSSSGSQRSNSSNSLSPAGHTSSSRDLVDPATPRSFGAASPGTPARSASTPRRGVRRTQSSEGPLTVPGGSGTSAGAAATSSSGRSAHRSGSGSSAGSAAGGGGGGAGPRVYPRQSSIRIGPLPKSALVEDGTLVDGAEAVLEVARQNLSANEVELIERALRKGKPLSVVESDGSKRPGRRTHHHSHGHRSTTPVSPGTPTTVVMGDSRHSTSEASASFTSDELDGAASNHPMDIASEHTTRSAKASPGEDACTAVAASNVNEAYDLRGAEENLSEEELRQIQRALDEDAGPVMAAPVEEHISEADASAIQRAIREAEEEEEMRNFRLALQMQQEEDERLREEARRTRLPQGNVRVMTRAELAAESRVGAFQAVGPPVEHHPLDHQSNTSPGGHVAAGFRMNANAGRQEWTRRDQNSVVGPNQEVRTKHDTTLDGQSNAHRLGLDEDETGTMSHVGNTAYNSFLQSVQRRNNRKGVSAHGTGRAGGSDADATRGGAMDANVRLQISRAINNGYIDRCNGVVKEGKEAVVYHADCGEESGGFDVAIKVFKRIQDFKGRGDYVDGDPRFAHENFRRISGREQLELWTEKEFRNLTRAIRAGVPAPSPLFHKDNILFMRFLGTDGWPAPQLREIDVRHGSKKWNALYLQVMDAIRRLYRDARLVHADLSEYNILVAPSSLVENASVDENSEGDILQAVLIDFGQAVDTRHPDAIILLQHDLERVKIFFSKQGVETMGAVEALAFVVEGED